MNNSLSLYDVSAASVWTMYPKISFQPIRTCEMHVQIRRRAVGNVSFRMTYITLHSVLKVKVPLD